MCLEDNIPITYGSSFIAISSNSLCLKYYGSSKQCFDFQQHVQFTNNNAALYISYQ